MKSSTAHIPPSNGIEAWLNTDGLAALKREVRACLAAMPVAIFISALLGGRGRQER